MSRPFTNPFFEVDFSKWTDSSKTMPGFKMPGFDISALMEIQDRNIEMVRVINQAIVENLQAFGHRQAELIQEVFEEATSLMNAMMSAKTSQEQIMFQAQASKGTVEKCMANARDASETLSKCHNQTMGKINDRLTDGVKELQELINADVAF